VSDTNSYEERIKRALDTRASTIDPHPEPVELTARIARRERRRTRALSAALVLALFAGPLLGFVVGRGHGNDGHSISAEAPASESGASDGTTATSSSVPVTTVPPELAARYGGSGASALEGVEFAPSGPFERAFTRDHDGITVRAYRAAVDVPATAGPPWWTPPAWCFPNAAVQADVSSEAVAANVRAVTYAQLPHGALGGSLSRVGDDEGAPLWLVIAQVPPDAARVVASFAAGATDEMQPVGHVAVLVGHASGSSASDAAVSLEAFDDAGRSLGRVEASSQGINPLTASDAAQCAVPQQLPPAGKEQPADVNAARAAVTATWNLAHDKNAPQAQALSAYDDPSGFAEIEDRMAHGPYGAQIAATTVYLDDIVFESATRAAFSYHWNTPGAQSFGTRFGEAVLVDGAWKITRATACQNFALGGETCP
jgi:hypothetical protein